MKVYREELKSLGLEITSRWLDEVAAPTIQLGEMSEALKIHTAIVDLEDIRRADVVVLFTQEGTTPTLRGGRHFESGYAVGIGKQLITVGPKENIFHYLPDVLNVPDTAAASKLLMEIAYRNEQTKSGINYLPNTASGYSYTGVYSNSSLFGR